MLKHQSRSAYVNSARAAHSGRVKSGAGVMGSSGSARNPSGGSDGDRTGGLHNDSARTSTKIFRDGKPAGGRS